MTNLVFHQATQKVKVLQWTEKLCRCLEQQYRDYSIRSIINFAVSSNLDAIASRLEQSLVKPLSSHVKKLIVNFFIDKLLRLYLKIQAIC